MLNNQNKQGAGGGARHFLFNDSTGTFQWHVLLLLGVGLDTFIFLMTVLGTSSGMCSSWGGARHFHLFNNSTGNLQWHVLLLLGGGARHFHLFNDSTGTLQWHVFLLFLVAFSHSLCSNGSGIIILMCDNSFPEKQHLAIVYSSSVRYLGVPLYCIAAYVDVVLIHDTIYSNYTIRTYECKSTNTIACTKNYQRV